MLSDLADKLSPIQSKASALWQEATDTATSLDDRLLDGIGNSLNYRWKNWLAQHHTLAWLIDHPIISLIAGAIALILIIRLVLTIYRVVANTIDRMWLWILRSPWLLLKFLIGWEAKPKIENPNTLVTTNYQVTADAEQLREIMIRLDKIQQQQEQIMQDLQLLKQQPLTVESQRLLLDKQTIENIIGDR